MKRNPGTPFGVQLFGNDPQIMAQAAQIVLEKADSDWIDLNMGCPVPKVAANGDGSGLMRTPELAFEIVRQVCQGRPGAGHGEDPSGMGPRQSQCGGICAGG